MRQASPAEATRSQHDFADLEAVVLQSRGKMEEEGERHDGQRSVTRTDMGTEAGRETATWWARGRYI